MTSGRYKGVSTGTLLTLHKFFTHRVCMRYICAHKTSVGCQHKLRSDCLPTLITWTPLMGPLRSPKDMGGNSTQHVSLLCTLACHISCIVHCDLSLTTCQYSKLFRPFFAPRQPVSTCKGSTLWARDSHSKTPSTRFLNRYPMVAHVLTAVRGLVLNVEVVQM